ncbi:MAG: hypothetical protein JNL82_30320 [Myxococcales bacterium]|nr:hypothetical protein [Myxococcales bacterium]
MRLGPTTILAAFLACAPGDAGMTTFGGPGGPPGDASTGSTSSSTSSTSSTGGDTSTGSTGSSEGSTAAETSTGLVPDFGPLNPVGCQGKIDFLFVISDSSNMADYQERLLSAYPAFMQTIADEFAEFDPHILVTPASGGWGEYECEYCLGCPGCTCDAGGPDYPCGAGQQLTQCDGLRGAGVVFPAGLGATNHPCDLGGRRYITRDTPDPAAAFECVARLGTPGGQSTAAINNMFEALDADMNGPDGCNEGFLREDALLVVTLIDINDGYSEYWPYVWDLRIVDKKGGDEDAIVVLAIESDSYLIDRFCEPHGSTYEAARLHVFADTVAHGIKGSVCAPDYAPYFEEAAALALKQCELLAPQ